MAWFRKKKNEVQEIDDRTKVEKSFEETGQKIGKKAGELTQKGLDKIQDVKAKLEEDGTMDKIRSAEKKIDDTAQDIIDKVSSKTKEVFGKKQPKDE